MKRKQSLIIRHSIFILLVMLSFYTQQAMAQGASISSVSPSSASPGDTVSVTITLSGENLPPNTPSSVTIGSISGSSISYNSPNISATFAIPLDESTGFKDVGATFSTPQGDNTITKTDGFAVLPSGGLSNPVYVNAGSSASTPDGSSWASAYTGLQDGIDMAALYYAANGTQAEVWVAAGTYTPTSDTDRTVYFEMKSGTAVYGGFSGSETALSGRNYTSNITILSGDIGTSGTDSDNSYHVLLGADNSTLDGFTISGGYAGGDPDADSDSSLRWHRLGGGMYFKGDSSASPSTMTISNCTFTDNYAKSGGAMYLYYYANPTISNCTFSSNNAQNGGAILCRVGSEPSITNSTFSENYAEWRGGGLFVGYGAKPSVTGTTFENNSTDGNGGAFYADDRSSQVGTTETTFTSCTFTGNSAQYRGGAISNYNNATYTCITSCTFSGNSANSGSAIACESGPEITLAGTNNTFGTSDNTDNDNNGCTITQAASCPLSK